MNQNQLIAALGVIALTPHIQAYLLANDPKALKQVCRAIRENSQDERVLDNLEDSIRAATGEELTNFC